MGSKGRWVPVPKPTSPIEDAWNKVNRPRFGTAMHLAMADALQGLPLDNYSQQVKDVVQSVKDEGLFNQIQGPVIVEAPYTYVDSREGFAFSCRVDAIARVNEVPTVIEWTTASHRITNLQELGGDKLAQLAGILAACATNNQEVKQALLGVLYPFGRPDFFWIKDFDLLREVWKTNLVSRIRRYYDIQDSRKGGLG